MAYVMGSSGLTNDQARAELCYWKQTESDTSVTYRFQIYIHGNGPYSTSGALSTSLSCSGQTTHTTTGGSATVSSGTRVMLAGNYDYAFSKTTSVQTKTVNFSLTSTGSTIHGTSSGSVSLSIPTLTKYTIKYDNGGHGTAPSSQTKYHGKTLTLRSAITATGYTFSKWSSSGDSKNYSGGASYTANKASTMTATWTTNSYTLTFNANGGTCSTASRSVNYNASYGTLPTATRTGYQHTGWATAKTNGNSVTASTKMGASNTTIYAQWSLQSYSISYNLNGGTETSSNRSSYNVTTSTFTLNNPERQYYNFLGWTGTNLSEPTLEVSIPIGSTGNRSYTANWERAYRPPTLDIISSKRVNSNHVDDDTGTYAAITFNWGPGDDAGTSVNPNKYNIVLTQISNDNIISLTNQTLSSSPVTAYVGPIDTEEEYTVEVTLYFNNSTYPDVTATDYISKAYFIIDINSSGKGIGFGGPVGDNDNGFYCHMNFYCPSMAGVIQMYAGAGSQTVTDGIATTTNIPLGWLLCDGSPLLISEYPTLAAALYDGTNYIYGSVSVDNVVTYFNLPDFRGRVPVGVGTGTSSTATEHTLGQTAGSERVTLTESQLPNVTGNFYIRRWQTSSGTDVAAAHGGSGHFNLQGPSASGSTANGYTISGSIANLGSTQVNYSFGNGESHNNMQPYLGINYIIATGQETIASN